MTVTARSVRRLTGGVTVRDYRGTGLCPPNGGAIHPVIFVQHIPVIRNVEGVGDLITLGNVLRAQGLAVQSGTDAEGNVALFTKMNELCWHARGANTISMGSENMHYGITEPWTERQYRAIAWLAVRAEKHYGIPIAGATLLSGNPTRVAKRGHTSHKRQSAAAGYHDRSDPGPSFHFGHMYELARHPGHVGRPVI
jgi:hypothetical protein